MSEYGFHPLANLLPEMTAEEFEDLKESIRQNGCRDQIWLERGTDLILDGRHRYRACKQLGQSFFFNYFDGTEDEKLRFVMDKNLHRRHLTVKQRAFLADRMATKPQGRPSEKAEIFPVLSQEEAAQITGVSDRSVRSAHTVRANCKPAIATVLEQGDFPVSVAEKVARLPDEAQERFVEELQTGKHPAHQVLTHINRDRKREQIIEAARTLQPLESLGKRFPVLVADPPWQFPQRMGHTNRSVENHYPTMDLDAICALPVPDICTKEAILFLWVTAPMAEVAFEVVKAWGFTYKSQMVWVKPKAGTGYHALNRHELVYICRRGDMPLQEREDTFDSVITAPPREKAHSSKPMALQERIEVMYPEFPKIELFSRCPRKGWDAWGLEAVEPDRSGVDAFFEEAKR